MNETNVVVFVPSFLVQSLVLWYSRPFHRYWRLLTSSHCSRVIRLTHQISQLRLGVIDTQRKITIIQHDRTWKYVKGTFTSKVNTTRHLCSLYKNYKQIVLNVSSGSRFSVSVLIVKISTYSVYLNGHSLIWDLNHYF